MLDEIVQILTEEKFMGKMVVILAGYEDKVNSEHYGFVCYF